jgi:hypothetical protein
MPTLLASPRARLSRAKVREDEAALVKRMLELARRHPHYR